MAVFNIYFASCVLLLLTMTWRTSTGLPVRTSLSAEKCAGCSLLFKKLLLNISGLLSSEDVCYSIISDKVVVKSQAETALACAPTLTQNPGCMMQKNSSFSESECLANIMKDLAHYAAVIQSYINSTLRRPEKEVPLLSATLNIIQNLRKNCSLKSNEESVSSEEDAAQMWGNNSFNNREEMCKIMRGFHVRTITINRAMGYISSGEHRK